jgi:hypothetical protein
MRATAGGFSNRVDLYDSRTGLWSTAQLSQARFALSATSVGTVAIFAGGNGKLLMIVFRVAVRVRLLSYARHCRWWFFECCGLVRQRNRTMVDGSAQSGALWAFRDICWNGGHIRWWFFKQ